MGAVGRPSDHEPSDGFHLNFNRCVIVKRLIEERLHSLEPSAIPSTGCRKAMFVVVTGAVLGKQPKRPQRLCPMVR